MMCTCPGKHCKDNAAPIKAIPISSVIRAIVMPLKLFIGILYIHYLLALVFIT